MTSGKPRVSTLQFKLKLENSGGLTLNGRIILLIIMKRMARELNVGFEVFVVVEFYIVV